jgi:outer membrane receptor for ferrienterochelin and colicin
MKFLRFGLAGLTGTLFLLSVTAFSSAQETDSEKGEKVYRLDKVIVRDHPLKDESMVVTPEVTVINVDEYQKAGKVENVQDILGDALGINVLFSSVTPAQNEGVYIRGMDQSRYQIFMDGRPLRLHGSNGYFKMDWTTLPADMIETIEIVRGSHSLLFPFSMGGAVNLITKKGKKTDDPTPSGSVKMGFGPYGGQSYSASASGGALNAIGYSIAAAHREGDGYLRGNDYNTDNVNGRFSLYLPTGGTMTYGIDHVDTVTGYAVINDPDDADSNYDPSYPIVRSDVDKFSHDYEASGYDGGKNQWEKTVNDQSLLVEQPLPMGQLRGQIYKQLSKRDRYMHNANGTDSSNYKEEYTGGIALDYLDFSLVPNHSFSLGGDYRNQGTPDNKDYYAITALFVQDVWSFTDAMSLTFGTRWYEFASDSYEFITRNPDRSVEREWCPKARLDYVWDDSLSLYASISREMRMP